VVKEKAMELIVKKDGKIVGLIDVTKRSIQTREPFPSPLCTLFTGLCKNGIPTMTGGQAKPGVFADGMKTVPVDESHAGMLLIALENEGYEVDESPLP
jgi:hypothetical protein